MKIFFKYKHWIVIQGIYVLMGILTGIIFRVNENIVGGLGTGLHFVSNTNELLIPLFSLILADLAFNIEYVEGTFLTHLLNGLDRKKWFLKRLITFYGFLIIQFLMAVLTIAIGVGIVTGQFGLSGLVIPSDIGTSELILETINSIATNIIKMLVFTSLAILISVYFPGKLLLGSVLSLGILFISWKLLGVLYTKFSENKLVDFVSEMFFLDDPNKGILYGMIWISLLTFLSIRRIDKVTISNQGT